jgi:hypothetical protein
VSDAIPRQSSGGTYRSLFTAVVRSETVDVKYRGTVNLKTFPANPDAVRPDISRRTARSQMVAFCLNESCGRLPHHSATANE